MKVLHIISGYDFGGAKTHVTSLIQKLKDEIDIKIVCFAKGEHYKEMKEKNLPVVLVEQSSRYDVRVIPKLIKIIKEENIDIVHCHGSRANWFTFLIKPFIKVPIITTVHSDYREDFKGGNLYRLCVYTILNSIALRFFDYYIGISEDFKNMLIKRGFKSNKIFSIYHGIDFDNIQQINSREYFSKKYGLEKHNDKKWVGIAARLEEVKGIDVFIKGAKKVLEKDKNVHFIIAGRGLLEKELKEMCIKLEIENDISFLGHINDMNDFFDSIYINCITSYSESLTYVLPEGGRMKKPSIASNVGGIPYIIKDDVTGLLFESGDYKSFAKKVLYLLNNEDKAKILGDNLYEHIKKNFSMQKMISDHIDIYTTIIEKNKK